MVNQITETKKFHYVYKLTNTQPLTEAQFYIGVHSSDSDPLSDGYMSSSKYIKQSIKNGEKFTKEILSLHTTRAEAALEEVKLHKLNQVVTDKTYYNRYEANSEGFTTFDFVVADNLLTGERSLVKKDIYDLDSNLVSTNAGKIIVYDVKSKTYKQVTIEEFDNNDNLIGSLKGRVIATNIITGERVNVSKEEFESNKHLVGCSSNTVAVTDIRNGATLRVPIEDYEKYDYYVSIIKNKVNVVDKRTNKNTQVSKEDFVKYEYYEACNKAKPVAVYSKELKKNILISKEEFQDGGYNGLNKNLVPVVDKISGLSLLVTQEEFENNNNYSHTSCKTFKIYNSQKELQHTITTGFATFCNKHNLPLSALKKSYQANGKPIYQNANNSIIKNGNIKYKGWYAIKEES